MIKALQKTLTSYRMDKTAKILTTGIFLHAANTRLSNVYHVTDCLRRIYSSRAFATIWGILSHFKLACTLPRTAYREKMTKESSQTYSNLCTRAAMWARAIFFGRKVKSRWYRCDFRAVSHLDGRSYQQSIKIRHHYPYHSGRYYYNKSRDFRPYKLGKHFRMGLEYNPLLHRASNLRQQSDIADQ